MERDDARLLKTIEYFCAQHTNSNGWKSPEDWNPTEDEERNYDTAHQDAKEWANGWNGPAPDCVDLEEEIDDGESHDVSTVKHWTAETVIGKLHIYSYNNNAWGHCDVLDGDDAPKTIDEWLRAWDDLPEDWLREQIGLSKCDECGEWYNGIDCPCQEDNDDC